MAIYHLTTKAVSRTKGQSVVASAAYRAGERLEDMRTDEVADYRRKSEVDHTEIIGFSGSRSELWNKAEQAEKRKDATLAKEYEIALPKELDRAHKIKLAQEYAHYLHERHNVAVDLCIHKIDSDNPHAHILTTTREVRNGNELGEKTAREWSDTKRKKHGLDGRKQDLIEARETWATLANRSLARSHVIERIDHRSLKAQNIQREPQIHVGVTATAMERKGKETDRGNINRTRQQINALISQLWQLAKVRRKAKDEQEKAQKIRDCHSRAELRKLKEKEIQALTAVDRLALSKELDRVEASLKAAKHDKKLHQNKAPEAPKGMLARFKRKEYDNAWSSWMKADKKLDESVTAKEKEAEKIKKQIADLRRQAEEKLKRDFPALYEKENELEQSFKSQYRAKQKARHRGKSKSKNRGFER